jgi:protocatechuate 4,5-dioxygenase beta chain
MAQIIGGLTTSHVPVIGQAIHAGRKDDPKLKPFFDAFPPVHRWMAEARPDAIVVAYNDHGLNFFLNNMPAFAIGTAHEYRNGDEGWGAPEPRVFKGDARLAWHIANSLVEDEFDISTCQEMVFDHGGITALDLIQPGYEHGGKQMPIPIVPIEINAVQPPLPTPRRCYKLGQALGKAIRSYPKDIKVLVVGSGGLSHMIATGGFINEEYDRHCMDKIVNDPEWLTGYTVDDVITNAGNQGLEFMTWLVMRGAVSGEVDIVNSVYVKPISHTGGAMMLMDARRQQQLVAAE